MDVVIKIHEKDYQSIKNGHIPFSVLDAIMKGTPLPEHHERLMILSEDKLKENQINLAISCQKWISELGLSNATVAFIEADKEDENNGINNR